MKNDFRMSLCLASALFVVAGAVGCSADSNALHTGTGGTKGTGGATTDGGSGGAKSQTSWAAPAATKVRRFQVRLVPVAQAVPERRARADLLASIFRMADSTSPARATAPSRFPSAVERPSSRTLSLFFPAWGMRVSPFRSQFWVMLASTFPASAMRASIFPASAMLASIFPALAMLASEFRAPGMAASRFQV